MGAKEVCACCGEWLDKRERVECESCHIPLHGCCTRIRDEKHALCEYCDVMLPPDATL